MKISVPGVQTFIVVRPPARNWASIEIGQSWSLRIVSGACECTITPLFRLRVARSALHLLAEEPVLEREHVVRELLLVEQVAEARAEVVVLVVHDADQAVLHAERVGVVVAELMMGELHHPAVEIAAVEDRLPVRRRSLLPRRGRLVGLNGERQGGQREQEECAHGRRTAYRVCHAGGR